ncbi:unnamed protein product [Lactuca saligna]|uniref:Uncharacterized protein n=1 Tax=Lactuca saligna TaxID=75948 RepID=A0AA35YYQ2_LACSI|nr:unnamed protein product [Lactuca saligna]
MSEEIPSDATCKPRSALGDVTNQVGKRGFSFVSTPGVQSIDGCKKDEGFQFAKKECLRVDNSQKENFHKEISAIASISKISCEIKEPCSQDGRKSITSSGLKAGDVVSPSDRNGSHVTVEAEEDERTDSVFEPQNPSKEKLENSLGMDDGDDACLDNLYSSKDDYLDCSKFPESQESRCGLEIKGDGFSSMCIESIKACPCSFCMKAAYLWSDLHYQDIKGRIAAIKKSQKEASILVNQNSKDGVIGRCGEENSEKFSNLESDLTGRWMSLFVHMEEIFVREGSQLETSLSILRELRDDCKGDSEEH